MDCVFYRRYLGKRGWFSENFKQSNKLKAITWSWNYFTLFTFLKSFSALITRKCIEPKIDAKQSITGDVVRAFFMPFQISFRRRGADAASVMLETRSLLVEGRESSLVGKIPGVRSDSFAPGLNHWPHSFRIWLSIWTILSRNFLLEDDVSIRNFLRKPSIPRSCPAAFERFERTPTELPLQVHSP